MTILSQANYATFDRRAGEYARQLDLFPGEALVFDRYRQQFSGAVLDIAVGAGRTTRALLPMARSYIGVDYSPGMIEQARRAHPGADLRVMDMRELPAALRGHRFDAILVSFNGIDYISWQKREKLLGELRSLLNDGGVLVFSTHDLDRAATNARFRLRKDLRLSLREVLTMPRRVVRLFVRGLPWMWRAARNRARNRRLQAAFDGYAVVNDDGDDYGLLTIYVSRERQLQQLVDTGWEPIEVIPAGSGDEPEYMHYFVAGPARPKGATVGALIAAFAFLFADVALA